MEPTRLCNTCRDAHHSALRDDGAAWEPLDDCVQIRADPTSTTPSQTLVTDEWPDLPRLVDSAQTGCEFCAFLREAILSRKFNDALEHSAEGGITKTDRRRLGLELFYQGDPRVD